MTEKPLHVRVAEALGWFGCEASNTMDLSRPHRGYPPQPIVGEPKREVPRYDTDWSATGPLIEKYGITVEAGWYDGPRWLVYQHDAPNDQDGFPAPREDGATPLIAVCHLILELAKAGKLSRS